MVIKRFNICKKHGKHKGYQKHTSHKDGGYSYCKHCKYLSYKNGFCHGVPLWFYNRIREAKRRCESFKHISYKHYGGRGIKFKIYINKNSLLDLYELYLSHGGCEINRLEIDRIDNNGHYEIGNIRFVTRSDNMRNRRSFIRLNQKGKNNNMFKGYYISPCGEKFDSSYKAADFAKVSRATISNWIKNNKNGWSFEHK